MKIEVTTIIEVDDARVIDAYNKVHDTPAESISELSEDELLEGIVNDSDILDDILGSDFEGYYELKIIE